MTSSTKNHFFNNTKGHDSLFSFFICSYTIFVVQDYYTSLIVIHNYDKKETWRDGIMTITHTTKNDEEGVFLTNKEYQTYKKLLETVEKIMERKTEYDERYKRG